MPVRGIFQINGLDEYLERIQAAGVNVDDAVAVALKESAPVVEEEMHSLLKASSESWTGGIDATIVTKEPQRDGNYTSVEIGVTGDDKGAFSKEFGTARQAAEPFVRPAFTNMRHLWRNAVKASLKRMGIVQ